MRRDGGTVLSVVMVAIFATFTAMAATYSPEARLAPLAVGIPGLLLSLAQLVNQLRGRYEGKEARASGDAAGRKLLAWFAAFIATTILIGIAPTALLLVFAYLRFRGREPLRTAAVVAVIFAAIIYATFEMALGIPLFAGVLRGGF
jgi:hypothetical protein